MKTKSKAENKSELWVCPKCGRKFLHTNQSHSCKTYPIENHFAGKENCRKLFDALCKKMVPLMGKFTIDSIECCIHLVHQSTFAAVKIMKDKIRVEFSLDYELINDRIEKAVQMSAHRYLYFVDVANEKEIDAELLRWLKESYFLK